jgi:putative ABC transport system substrate-binding protein
MDRRTFLGALTSGFFAAPLAADAQQAGRLARVGHLSSLDRPTANHAAFQRKLGELGWVEGRSITLENRFAGRDLARLTAFAAELSRLPVDLIFVTGGAESVQAAKHATTTIPIVFAISSDPVGAGLVSSLARPEANITGFSSVNTELDGKRLALLKQALPSLKRVAVLRSSVDVSGSAEVRATDTVARSLEVQLQVLGVRGAQDLNEAINIAKAQGAGGLLILGSATLYEFQRRVADLLTNARLPAIAAWRQFPEAGGLMSYGADIPEMFRRAAVYVDKILRGAKPADLPVELPTKFELVINLKTAKALGLTIPQSLLQRADQVIE